MAEQDPRQQELMAVFGLETEDRVVTLNRLLLSLEQGEGEEPARVEAFNALYREAHSLEGAARAVGLGDMERLAHGLESVLDQARGSSPALTRPWFDAAFRAVDAFGALHRRAVEGESSPLPELPEILAGLEAGPSKPAPGQEPGGPGPSFIGLDSGVRPAPDAGGSAPGSLPAGSTPSPILDAVGADPRVRPVPAGGDQGGPAGPPLQQPPQQPLESSATPLAPTAQDSPGAPARPTAVRGDGHAGSSPESVRVAVGKLDALLAQAGELAVTTVRIRERLSEFLELRHDLDDWRREWRAARGIRAGLRRACSQLDRQDGGLARDVDSLLRFAEAAEQRVQAVLQRVDGVAAQLRHDSTQLGLVTHAIEDEVMAVRLLPVSTLFGPFERMVRDLARSQGKEVRLLLAGGDTEIDRKVLEQLRDPLMHMLRNAVDHGIEPPDQRQKGGKPPGGTVRLSASQRGGAIEIEMADDGAGIDPAILRQAAVRKGLLSEEQAAALDDASAIELIYHPGFSSRSQVTETSGRGVGMDVVRANVERLNGHVTTSTTPGLGTRFTISVPLTLATTRVILAEVDGQLFAIPSSAVERNSRLQERQLVSLEGARTVPIEGHPVPIVELADVLDRPRGRDRSQDPTPWQPFVVLAQGGRRIALLVDRLVAEQEIVVKHLGWPLRRVRHVGGAAVLGSGQTVVILNPADLLKTASRLVAAGARPGRAVAPAAERRKPRLLVVDDSLATRTLLRGILEAAGYDTAVAADGAGALSLARREPVDLIVSDVEMPGLDGFELTAEVRRDEKLRHLPVVLLTSLAAQEHRERGVAVGADAYIVKSDFDQVQLLEAIGRLL